MAKSLFKLTLDNAFEDAIGQSGANKQRYSDLLNKLMSALPRIRQQPQHEAEPLFALPSQTEDLAEIEDTAKEIAGQFKMLVIAGMGGSSLGAETLANIHGTPKVKLCFIDNIDPQSLSALTESLDWEETAFLIVSKSGNTLETLSHMALLLRHAKSSGADISRQFFVITIANGNPLHTIAKYYGMKLLAHDPKLGGRFSILSNVGLLPAAVIGMDVRALRAGAKQVLDKNYDGTPGDAACSAALHLALMEKNIRMNVMMHYGDRLGGLASWYRQCWGESLGKCAQATTPIRSRGATDQHSQLQLYLDGPRDKFFSMMLLDYKGKGDRIDYMDTIDDRLSFLKRHTLGDVIVAEQRGTMDTLIKRGCPVRSFEMQELNEEVLGALLMHFSLEIIFAAELMGINAFDQPAVEDGKVLALQYLRNG